ncbi:MAG TPA: immunoglobulin domain-containing protein, partial [Chlorobiota bacterium]|nr:immunoglobulin domain-containing protein [Chlorobiota bacterium]
MGGTQLFTSSAPTWYATADVAVTLPFQFSYGGVLQSNIWIGGNGWVTFGAGLAANSINPLTASGSATAVVSAFGSRLTGYGGGDVTWTVTGTAPNRTAVIQWRNATRRYYDNGARDVYNFQIRIREHNTSADGSRIDIVYGPMTVFGRNILHVGIGANNTVSSPLIDLYTNTWQTPHWFTTRQQSYVAPDFIPASGLTYSWRLRQNPVANNDAGVLSVSVGSSIDAGVSTAVTATVKNWGTNNLDSATIEWKVNGSSRVPVRYYPQPAMLPGEERTIQIGTVSFAERTFNTIEAQTTLPNGGADVNAGNDAFVRFAAPRISGTFGISPSGSSGTFAGFFPFLRHLAVAGIKGNVTVEVSQGTYDESLWVPAINPSIWTVTLRRKGTDSIRIEHTVYSAFPTYAPGDVHAVIALADGAEHYTFQNMVARCGDGSTGYAALYTNNVGDSVRIVGGVYDGPSDFATLVTAVPGETITLRSLTSARDFLVDEVSSSRARGSLRVQTTGVNTRITNNHFVNVNQGMVLLSIPQGVIEDNVITTCGCLPSSTAVNFSSVNLARFARNVVTAVQTTGSVQGVSTANSGNLTFENNMISVAGSTQSVGLIIEARVNAPSRVIHNTINITGSSTSSACLLVMPAGGTIDVLNNIFHNPGNGSSAGFAIWSNSTTNLFGQCDFNNIYSAGPDVGRWGSTFVARNTTGNPLANWITISSKDQNSVSVPVVFTGGTDLHLLEIDRRLTGTTLTMPTVPVDIDGELRVKPYMGADEVRPSIRIVQQPESRYACLGESFTFVTIADVTPGATVTYQWQKDGNDLIGQTNAILSISNVGYNASGVYTCKVLASDGTTETELVSDEATLIVVRNTEITMQPASQPVGLGQTVNLEVQAEAVG